MELGKLVPLAFKLLGQADNIRKIIHDTEPVFHELRKVWPEAAPLIRDVIDRLKRLHVLLGPTLNELPHAWTNVEPVVTEIAKQVWPELVAQWAKDHESTLPSMSVRWWQENLNTLGASPKLKVDGNIGEATTKAVEAFQRKEGLDVDGWVGPETLTRMFRRLAELEGRS